MSRRLFFFQLRRCFCSVTYVNGDYTQNPSTEVGVGN